MLRYDIPRPVFYRKSRRYRKETTQGRSWRIHICCVNYTEGMCFEEGYTDVDTLTVHRNPPIFGCLVGVYELIFRNSRLQHGLYGNPKMCQMNKMSHHHYHPGNDSYEGWGAHWQLEHEPDEQTKVVVTQEFVQYYLDLSISGQLKQWIKNTS